MTGPAGNPALLRCRSCGEWFTGNEGGHGNGRQSRYCTNACRQRAYRARRAAALRRAAASSAVLVLALSMQLHCVPAAAALCRGGPLVERPHVRTVDHTVRVDNRCNGQAALVVVWRMYENSSETFHAPAGQVVVQPTLHYGRVRVWVIYSHDPDVSYLYRKRMR